MAHVELKRSIKIEPPKGNGFFWSKAPGIFGGPAWIATSRIFDISA
jgi:hypothetical protein